MFKLLKTTLEYLGFEFDPEPSMVGKEYLPPLSLQLIEKHGYPITLKATNEKWVGYFPTGYKITVDKNTNAILKWKWLKI